MFCSKCGTELPDEANFCLKCGQPTRGEASRATLVEYEFCTITGEDGRRCQFWQAQCDGTVIAQSRKVKEPRKLLEDTGVRNKFNRDMHQAGFELVAKLVNQRWEPFTYYQSGCVHTMRRAKKETL